MSQVRAQEGSNYHMRHTQGFSQSTKKHLFSAHTCFTGTSVGRYKPSHEAHTQSNHTKHFLSYRISHEVHTGLSVQPHRAPVIGTHVFKDTSTGNIF